ncbi:DedA family protein [Ferrovibrio sp. MS7]|uniref:DedA family protein n=1 Tax=Ferrovibrio plantarum TaxID=3119164 RepID=UPI001B58262C|nr:DedA family protein [Ferrovibrio sp.]
MDLDIYKLIEEYRDLFYVITFIWTFLEGETFVIFAGAAASQGMLNQYILIAAAWLGSFSGDQLYFWIGRKYGHRLLKRFPRMQGGVNVALGMLHKYHIGFILSFRFIYGVRNFSSLAMGMSPIGWPRFAALNFIAAGLWANAFAWGGYLLGKTFEAVLGDVAKDFGLVMLGVFALVGVILFFTHRRSKASFERKIAEQQAAEQAKLPDASKPETKAE